MGSVHLAGRVCRELSSSQFNMRGCAEFMKSAHRVCLSKTRVLREAGNRRKSCAENGLTVFQNSFLISASSTLLRHFSGDALSAYALPFSAVSSTAEPRYPGRMG